MDYCDGAAYKKVKKTTREEVTTFDGFPLPSSQEPLDLATTSRGQTESDHATSSGSGRGSDTTPSSFATASVENFVQRINQIVDQYEKDGKYCTLSDDVSSVVSSNTTPATTSTSARSVVRGRSVDEAGFPDIRDYCIVEKRQIDGKLKCPLTLNNRNKKVACPFMADRRDVMQLHYATKHPNTRKMFRLINLDDGSHCEMCPEVKREFSGKIEKMYHYFRYHNAYIRHFCPHRGCMRPYANLTHSSPWAHRKNHHKDDPSYVSKTLKPFYSILKHFVNSEAVDESTLLEVKKVRRSKNSKKCL